MKKILLGTTALIGAVGFTASAALAEGPRVSVGGFIDFQAGFVSEDNDAGRRGYLFQNDTEIHVKVDGKADNGLGYGAVIELEADASPDADGEGFNADKTYIYLQGGWGRVELGANTDAAQALKVDASTFARATGGVDGDWYDFVNLDSNVAAGVQVPFILSPDLPVAHGAATSAGIAGAFGASEDATKITYYSPRFSGFQFGVSFAPDAGNVGTASGFTADNNGDAENVFNAGINYTGKWNNVGIAASATGEWGSAELAGQDDLAAYALGLNLTYAGWTLGGSWIDWGDSLSAANTDADAWNIGLAYEFGPWGASISYLDSDYASNDFQNISIGADYKLAPGLVPYAEVSFIELDASGAGAIDNDATVFMIGTELSF